MKKKKRALKKIKNPQYQDPWDRYTPEMNRINVPLSPEEQKRSDDFFWYGVCVGLYR